MTTAMPDEEINFGSDEACQAVTALWVAVARKAQANALDASFSDSTLKWASLSEAAFWQATGENDGVYLGDLVKAFTPEAVS